MPIPIQTAELADRGLVRVGGPDARKLLQGLVTNDLEAFDPTAAIFAGLLTPQGKILFDFFIVPAGGDLLIDIERGSTAAFIKRLAMYKLRADVSFADISDEFSILAQWSEGGEAHVEDRGAVDFADPREMRLGTRIVAPRVGASASEATIDASAWDARRVALGVPEGGKDYDFGDAYPHEVNFDIFNGVSFSKGCYVGQEVVARMQNKTVVRKRIVKVIADAPLRPRTDVTLDAAIVGRVGTVAGHEALAMLRLDRALEAEQKCLPLRAGDIALRPQSHIFERYRSASAAPSVGSP